MRRITAATSALVLTTGILLGATGTGTASAQAPIEQPVVCLGENIALFTATALCVVDRYRYPFIIG